MGRMRENPRYNVISMRISDEERDTLEQLMNTTHKSVSDIMREAMELLKSQLANSKFDRLPSQKAVPVFSPACKHRCVPLLGLARIFAISQGPSSFELRLELFDHAVKLGHLGAQKSNLLLQFCQPLIPAMTACRPGSGARHAPPLPTSGSPAKVCAYRGSFLFGWRGSRTMRGGVRASNSSSDLLHGSKICERVHPLPPRPQFSHRLRPPQQKLGEHRQLRRTQPELLRQQMAILRHSPPFGRKNGQLLEPQRVERPDHLGLFEFQHREAVRFLVAGVRQGIEGEGVIFRGRQLFFDQAAEHPDFHCHSELYPSDLLCSDKLVAHGLCRTTQSARSKRVVNSCSLVNWFLVVRRNTSGKKSLSSPESEILGRCDFCWTTGA